MKRAGIWLFVATMAALWVGVARAERNDDAINRGAGADPAAKPAPPRAGMFAAASVASARRMPIEQREERRFLKDAAAASRFEGEASKLALARSADPGVRSLAAALAERSASTGTVLHHMLHGRGMAPPMLENEQRKILNRLAKLQGAKFDREYIDAVGLRNQQEDIRYYERAALAARDAPLKAWISQTLPTLRAHLSMAERISAARDARVIKANAPRKGVGATQPVVARPGEKTRS